MKFTVNWSCESVASTALSSMNETECALFARLEKIGVPRTPRRGRPAVAGVCSMPTRKHFSWSAGGSGGAARRRPQRSRSLHAPPPSAMLECDSVNWKLGFCPQWLLSGMGTKTGLHPPRISPRPACILRFRVGQSSVTQVSMHNFFFFFGVAIRNICLWPRFLWSSTQTTVLATQPLCPANRVQRYQKYKYAPVPLQKKFLWARTRAR